MDLSPAKLTMVEEEAMDTEGAEAVDIMEEETTDMEEEGPMAVVEVTRPWVEGQEVAGVATIPPSGPTTIEAWA